MGEIIDIIDEQDNVIGSGEKEKICPKKILHRVVTIFVLNSSGHILLQVRGKNQRHPLLYDSSVSGHVRSGENYLEAAERELKEELGITTDGMFFSHKTRIKTKDSNTMGECFVTLFDGKINYNKGEIEFAHFFSFDEIGHMVEVNRKKFSESFLKNLKMFLERLDKTEGEESDKEEY